MWVLAKAFSLAGLNRNWRLYRRLIFNRDESKQDSLNGRLSLSQITHSKIRSLIKFSFLTIQKLGVNMNNTINKTVTITALGFKKNLTAYPKVMEYEGKVYDFVDAGLSCNVQSGERTSRIYTLTDGLKQFRLRSDSRGGLWTLLSISA